MCKINIDAQKLYPHTDVITYNVTSLYCACFIKSDNTCFFSSVFVFSDLVHMMVIYKDVSILTVVTKNVHEISSD